MAYRKAAPNGGSSSATREIAALDFLLNIPLEAEQEIVRFGLEAEQNCISISGGAAAALSANVDISCSIDDDEKLESDQSRHLGILNDRATFGNSTFGDEGTTPSVGWWQPMIQKNKEFFSAEEERIKMREQLELETGQLEAPDGINALSAMEEGKLKLQTNQDYQKKSVPLSQKSTTHGANTTSSFLHGFVPGRRLDGYEATHVKIPCEEAQTELKTTMRTVVRTAAIREWERKMVSPQRSKSRGGKNEHNNEQCLLDGRIFFSGTSSYPMAVFSVIKYEPKKEEENRRRKKLEALGFGGSQFVMPSRDWRGISYRSLLPRVERRNKSFNMMIENGKKEAFERRRQRLKRNRRRERRNRIRKQKKEESDDADTGSSEESIDESNEESRSDVSSDVSIDSGMVQLDRSDEDVIGDYSSSSEESTAYYPGFLDDPEMTKGRHRHVMVGDRGTGCVVSSTIQFVSPDDLKADLNKQFRERFDQWEPPKPQRKYIGARVIDGCYTLIDPTGAIGQQEDNDQRTSDDEGTTGRRKRKSSITPEIETIRMPPSLTLSKIRNIKQQALLACIDCNIEVSTVALACVYFERLTLDCRVDKSNRRLTFAACLLIAIKINEANVALVNEQPTKTTKKGVGVLKSWIQTKKDGDVFASLLEFFTHEWALSLKTLFAAEFGVFAALGFKLHSTPSQVAFHFKRLMKTLEWSSRNYLGKAMYEQWQVCLLEEAIREDEKEQRHEKRQQRREEKLLKLQHDFQMMEEVPSNNHHQSIYSQVANDDLIDFRRTEAIQDTPATTPPKKKPGINIFNRIGLRKSTNNLHSLLSPQRQNRQIGEDEINVSEPIGTSRVSQINRSTSTPDFKNIRSAIEKV